MHKRGKPRRASAEESDSSGSQRDANETRACGALDLLHSEDGPLDHARYQLDGALSAQVSLRSRAACCRAALQHLLDREAQPVLAQQLYSFLYVYIASNRESVLAAPRIVQLYVLTMVAFFVDFHTKRFGHRGGRTDLQLEAAVFGVVVDIYMGLTRPAPACAKAQTSSGGADLTGKAQAESSFHRKRKLRSPVKSAQEPQAEAAEDGSCLQELLRVLASRWGCLATLLGPASGCEDALCTQLAQLLLQWSLQLMVHETADLRLEHGSDEHGGGRQLRLQEDSVLGVRACQALLQRSGAIDAAVARLVPLLADEGVADGAFERWVLLCLLELSSSGCAANQEFVAARAAEAVTAAIFRLLAPMEALLGREAEAARGECVSAELFPELYAPLHALDGRTDGLQPEDTFMAALRLLVALAPWLRDGAVAELSATLVRWSRRCRGAGERASSKGSLTLAETPAERLAFDLGLFGITLMGSYAESAPLAREAVCALPVGEERAVAFLCAWLVAETASFMADLLSTDVLAIEPVESASTHTRPSSQPADEHFPLSEIVLCAHVCMLLRTLLHSDCQRAACAALLPRSSFWLPTRILKAFITLQGKTGLMVVDTMRNALATLRELEKFDSCARERGGEVQAGERLVALSPARPLSQGGQQGRWKWVGRDFVWLDGDAREEDEDRGLSPLRSPVQPPQTLSNSKRSSAPPKPKSVFDFED